MKFLISLIIIAIIIIICVFVFFYLKGNLSAPASIQNSENSVCFSSKCFSVKLAKTNAEREKGLMFVTQLDENGGMIFIFDKEGIYPFWMKNTLIPLDMIWIGENKQIVFIGQNIQPCKTFVCPVTNPSVKAKYVLEVNAGICEKYKIKIGDNADFKIKD